MLKQSKMTWLGLLLLPLGLLNLSGCTVIGFGVGWASDVERVPVVGITPEALEVLPEGTLVEISLNDGKKFDADYLFYSQPDSCLVLMTAKKTIHRQSSVMDFQSETIRELQLPQELRVPLAEVALMKIRKDGVSGRVVGTLVGAGLDVAVVAMAMSTWEWN